MKYNYILLLSAAGFLAACNNQPTKTDQPTEISAAAPVNETTCYAGNSGRDSIDMLVKTDGDKITGDLNYRFFEKDQNHGTINGMIKGDTLIADYMFQSEGQQSVRQVAFLKKGDDLVEGYGDMEERDGKMVFKNTGGLDFSNSISLKKTECK